MGVFYIFANMDYSVLKKAISKVVQLPQDDFAVLSMHTSRKQLKKGQVLLKEGQICRSFYLVESGHLRTWYNKDGVPINQNFTFEDNFTSIIKSLRNRQPSDLTIEAGEDAIVWLINMDLMPAQMAIRPQLSRFVRRVAFNMLLNAESHNDLLKFYSPTERYHYIEKNNPQLLQRIPLSQIASYLGLARESLSRIRARSSKDCDLDHSQHLTGTAIFDV
jgi:CRP-like cAMP-binding protein